MLFAEEDEWNDDPEAKVLTKTVISSFKLSERTNITPKSVGKKKSLLRTLQTLGSVPNWNKSNSAPREAGSDSETEAILTPHTKRKKKRSKRGRKKVAASGEEDEVIGDLGAKEKAAVPVKEPIKAKKPVKAGFKKVKNTESIQGGSKQDSKSIKDEEKAAADAEIERLNRKQWKNKMKNKKKCKNKFKIQNGENNTPPETSVQKDTEDGPKAASDVNRETAGVQTPQRQTKKNKEQKEGERKTQKRKKVPEGKEMTFIETASTPGTVTVQNNKNFSGKKTKGGSQVKAVPLGNSKPPGEEEKLHMVREEQYPELHGSKRRKQEESKEQDRRREKLRRMLHGQSPEKKKLPAEQEETLTIEVKEASVDRSAALRSRMEQRLESARFRYINEVLYTTSSGEAKRMFRQDPQAFGIYHRGFTAQVQRWPANPVDAIISYIRHKPASLVVADFGCGDCKIALSVKNKVHSFDLALISDRVTVCDMANVPLKDGTVDIAVFCLSLMGTNLGDFLVEANRVLVMGGILKIAEVASRFENVRNFMGALSSLGFKLVTKDTENSHFYSFEFEKIAEAPERIKAGGLELRPCVYKKR
ncbi:ribosomal RNA-processing protein 8-like [Salvelinus namaycush]|uniref:Ribosomal RNA-processing protein 8 n=1 Tax=Salvelinus namaycush TaxID=8040 RepID=A0A8U0P450_SALNM|nr:ribosomal RNA-processing protein 8-like [Salvelinus namaycush]